MRTNVFLDLQSRQWRQVEDWNAKKLGQLAEERALLGLRESLSRRTVVENKQSTLSLAFSCDGLFMASSHLTHDILIYKTQPSIEVLRVLPPHPSSNRSPWCLTFHPSHPHYLLSGSLGGTVLLWDVQAGVCLCVWSSGVSSPINSLVFLPKNPDYFLVACDRRLCLMHYRSGRMKNVWTSRTTTIHAKVRLVLHHPEDSMILTAVTNRPYRHFFPPPRRSSYRLQMYLYSSTNIPDFENSSTGLIATSVRVLSPQSVVLTSHYVISSSDVELSVYSIQHRTFGQCLCCICLSPDYSVVSLDLSPCQCFLLLNSSGNRNLNRPCLKVFWVIEGTSSLDLKPCCELSERRPVNVACWLPVQSREGGVCMGTQQGAVEWWGAGPRSGERVKGEMSRQCRLDWCPHDEH